ncbi:MAG TPA: amidohydrolase family protein [Acidimicrobiia bacterium]|nr:amidohydrolase family protein [Acidimicrobiia bacterium]
MDPTFRPVDSDQHYYERIDACTRHLDPKFKDRGIQVVEQGTHKLLLAGGRLFRFIPNPTFDPVIVPGCMDPMFRGQVPEGVDPRSLTRVEPIHPEYQDPDARLAVLDEQGLDRALLFPTLGCGVEQVLRSDVPATVATVRAFNRALEDDWGFAYADRLIAAPMLSLADPDAALEELDDVIEHGARIVHLRPAPVPDGHGGGRSFGHASHDPVWARLAEASIPVAFHLGDSGYELLSAAWGGRDRFEPFRAVDPMDKLVVSDRAIHDTIGNLVVHGVFARHPKLRVASIENGSDWVHTLIKRLRKQANQTPWWFEEDPLETIRRHVWITPYYEEDMRKLADTIGVEHVLFGSDWPHGEGLAHPMDFLKELHAFADDEVRLVMRDNALALLGDGVGS